MNIQPRTKNYTMINLISLGTIFFQPTKKCWLSMKLFVRVQTLALYKSLNTSKCVLEKLAEFLQLRYIESFFLTSKSMCVIGNQYVVKLVLLGK